MERATESVVYLDTHIACWLYEGLSEKLSQSAIDAIESGRLFVSPMVDLELQYLYELGKIAEGPEKILSTLAEDIELQDCRMCSHCQYDNSSFASLKGGGSR